MVGGNKEGLEGRWARGRGNRLGNKPTLITHTHYALPHPTHTNLRAHPGLAWRPPRVTTIHGCLSCLTGERRNA